MQFHQVVRATTPLFTIILNYMFLSKQTAPQVYASLIPVVAGVGLATYGDYYVCSNAARRIIKTLNTSQYTFLGLFLTALGAFLAAVKGIATNTLLVGRSVDGHFTAGTSWADCNSSQVTATPSRLACEFKTTDLTELRS